MTLLPRFNSTELSSSGILILAAIALAQLLLEIYDSPEYICLNLVDDIFAALIAHSQIVRYFCEEKMTSMIGTIPVRHRCTII